jgi:hypothetical protein
MQIETDEKVWFLSEFRPLIFIEGCYGRITETPFLGKESGVFVLYAKKSH